VLLNEPRRHEAPRLQALSSHAPVTASTDCANAPENCKLNTDASTADLNDMRQPNHFSP
jgi:hypothetical protein